MPGPIHFVPPVDNPDLSDRIGCGEMAQPQRVMLGEPYIRDPNWQPGPMAAPGKPWIGKAKKGKRR